MKKAFIDANVILRYFTNDPPEMAEKALKIFTAAQEGLIRLILAPITVAEIIWVLESFYGFSKFQVADTLSQFISSDGLDVIDLELLVRALNIYHEKNIDFTDAYLAATALGRGLNNVFTFDRHFNRIPGISIIDIDMLSAD